MRTTYHFFIKLCGMTAALACLPLHTALANTYSLPGAGNSIIGDVSYTSAWGGETLVGIGQRNNIGLNAMINANPGLGDNTRLSSGTHVKVPAKFLLPPLPRKGIVVNVAEMRMYYYPEGSSSVMTFPIGIGKLSKTMPLGNTTITRKKVNPTWTPPESIRSFNRDQGIELPYAMGPGPDNPLGPYAIYLGFPTFLIHSTIFPESIGRRASFGCIRMHETDIKQFFPLVEPGTPVAVIDMPNKVAWNGNSLYLETHPSLEESTDKGMSSVMANVQEAIPHHGVTLVNWQAVAYLADQQDGIPHEIGMKIN
jgi:L,D-transpeptidase ErfK/SrfK